MRGHKKSHLLHHPWAVEGAVARKPKSPPAKLFEFGFEPKLCSPFGDLACNPIE